MRSSYNCLVYRTDSVYCLFLNCFGRQCCTLCGFPPISLTSISCFPTTHFHHLLKPQALEDVHAPSPDLCSVLITFTYLQSIQIHGFKDHPKTKDSQFLLLLLLSLIYNYIKNIMFTRLPTSPSPPTTPHYSHCPSA